MWKVKGWQTGQVYLWLLGVRWGDGVPSRVWLSLAPPGCWGVSHRQVNASFRMWQESPCSRFITKACHVASPTSRGREVQQQYAQTEKNLTHTARGEQQDTGRGQGAAGHSGVQSSNSDLCPLRGSSRWLAALLFCVCV